MWLFNRFNILRLLPTGILILLAHSGLFAKNPIKGTDPVQEIQVSIGGSPITNGFVQDFGSVNLLSTSGAVTVVIENIGTPEDLILGTISLTGAHASDFVLNTTGLVTTLSPGATTSFTVSFAPTASGARAAGIEISSDDANTPFTISLEGVGVKLTQTITFNSLAAKTYGDASFTLSATASSSLAISYTADNPLVATISGNTVMIVGAGTATITASQAGDATYDAAASVPQTLVINKATPVITWNSPSDIIYGTALSGTQLNAATPVAGTFTYTPDVGTVLNAGTNQTLSVDFVPDNTTNYNSVIGRTVQITVNKATPVITWNNPSDIIYGTALSGTQLNAATPVAGTFTYTPDVGTVLNAGTNQTLSVDFVPDNTTNYNSVIGRTVQITVNKATPVITWNNPSDIIYGTALSGTQLNAATPVAGTFTYTPDVGTVLNAGTDQTLSVDFVPDNTTNYNSVIGRTVQITVNKATPVITWNNPSDIIYGTALSGTQLNAATPVAGTFTYTPDVGTVLNAGTNQTLSVDFVPDNTTNYNSVIGRTVQITVNKATPVITWNNPSDIIYGTALSGTQLNAATPVAGTFTYTPDVGTVLNAGTNQTLSVDFVPTNTTNYNSVAGRTVTINVNKATPVISWIPPSAITYGTPLSASQLSAIATVPGIFTYTPDIGTVLNAGTDQTLSVDFVPTSSNYNSVNGTTVTITVNKATPIISWTNPTAITYGTALGAAQLNATTPVAGNFTYTPASGAMLNAGVNQTLSVDFTPLDANNYNSVVGTTRQLTVNKAVVTATAENKTRVYNVANPTFTIVFTGFVNGDNSVGIDVTPSASSTAIPSSTVGPYPITISGGSDNNYSFNYVSGTLTITKATPVISWATPSSITYGTALSATQLNATADVAGSFSYFPSSGTKLNAGSTQVLSVNFTPSNANYNVVNSTTVLIDVTKALLTVTANNQSRTYGAANPTLTLSYSGFVNSENASVLNTAPSAATTAIGTTPVDTYPITVSGGVDNNYDFIYVPGTFTITKASVNALAVDASRAYGAANPSFTINYTGFLNGENFSVLDTAPTAATTAIVLSNTGLYPITVSGGVDNNYTIVYTPGNLMITKATVTATASNASRVYNVANPAFTVTYSGFVNSETSAVIDVPATTSTTAVLTSPVGTYPTIPSGGSDNNYTFTYVNGTLTITKATPIVSWTNPASITYGTALGATQLNATTTVAGTFVYTPPAGTILNAGVGQVLSVNFTPTDGVNYNPVTGTSVTITVTKANPIITWANPASITYGTTLGATQLNASSSVGGTFVYNPSSGTVLNAGVGQTLTVNFTPSDGANYNVINGTTALITVNKATPTITWLNPSPITYGTALSSTQLNATASVPGSFVYAPGLGTILNAGVNQSLSVNFTPTDAVNYNPVNGTTVLITVDKATPTVTWTNPAAITYGTALGVSQLNATASVPGTFVYTPPAGTILNSGVGQELSVNFTPTNSANYNPVNGTTVLITVNKGTPVITWPNPASITYGTALSATQLNATSSVPGTFTYTPTIGTLLDAGANQILSVDFTPTNASNYNAVNGVQRLITVNKANPVITWANPASIIYGTQLSATQLNATSNVPGVFVYTPASGATLNVGTNQTLSLNFTPTDAANYNSIIGRTALITVNKATPIVTWSAPLPLKVNEPLTGVHLNATANVPGTFTYTPPLGTTFASTGNYPLSVSFTPTDVVNYNSVPNTQVQITINSKDNPVITWVNPASITYGTTLSGAQLNATANVPGTFVYTPAAGTLLNAGVNQTLSVNFIPTDGVNYNSVNRSVQITVNKAVLTATANSTSRVYGASNPSFIINYSGFVNSESATVIDTAPTASCSAIAGDNAGGTFPIIPAGGVDNNYTFSYVNGSLSITKAPLTARADDKSRSYGLSNPTFSISYTGFVNGDTQSEITTPAASTVATPVSNVGTYPITLSGGSSVNYNLTLQSGTLTVNISPLIAHASDLSKIYGQVNPTLTIVYVGFLNGDNVSSITQPTISTTAGTASAVGSYPITLSGGSAVNYGIILQPGTMTINKATLSISADNKTRLYGSANPALTVSYSGFVNSENQSVIDSSPTISTSATPASNVGSYPISLSGGSDNNYNLVYTNGTLSVTKVNLTASVSNTSKVYGSVNPAFTINYSGFVNSENSSEIDLVPVASTTATVSSSVGSYPITASSGSDNNYSFTYVAGSLTINKAPLVATALDAGRPYGVPNPTFVINYSGFVNGETVSVINTLPTATTTAIVASPIGNYPITVSGGVDNNYSFTYVNGVLSVGKSNPVITWNNPTAIIFGTALSATQLNATASVAGTFTYNPAVGTVLNAGVNQILSVNFTPTDGANYNPINGTTVLITVNKATPLVTWSAPAAITYGTALTSTQLNATASVAGTFTYSPPGGTLLDAGANQILSVNFTPTNSNNYNSVNGTTVQITVNKATPVVTWSSPAAITYGTALGSAQLNASSTVPGAFTYAPVSGTILNAGVNQTLSVNFTPTNTTNYNAVNNTTTQITVNKATPTITWPAPAAITYGTALSTTQLNATANTTGTFTYTPATGTVLNAGTNQVLSVNFTPTNLTNFNVITGVTTLINVNKATPIITWSNPADISYGVSLSSSQLNATASVPGTFTYTPAVGTLLNAGTNQTLSVNFIPTSTANYNPVNGTTAQLTVNKVNLTVKADNKTRVYGATNPPFTISYTGFVNAEIETVLDTKPMTSSVANASTSVGDYAITITGGNDNNYNFVYTPGILAITKATLTATADNKSRLLATSNPLLTVSYSGFLNSDAISDLDNLPTATTTATISSPVGSYPITVSGGSDNNYNFNFVSGTLTVNPNFPPTLKNFEIQAKEDISFNFTYEIFGSNFTSFSTSPITYIKVISLPINGILSWNGTPVVVGAEVLVVNGVIENFTYLSNLNFSGSDSFKWNAFDGSFLATEAATVSIKIQKVNDAPTLSNIEPQSLLYSLGDPAIPITETIVINDVDDNLIYSAKVSITENFAKGDVLSLEASASSAILSTYNANTGELELTGKDSRANYEAVLKKVEFSSPVSGEAIISDKKISLVVKDSVDFSNTVSRIVSITEVFPELSIVTAFTPNDDGVNDLWDFVNLDFYSSIAISVFDRNGARVFTCETKDCTWDGTLNGKALPPGPYYYTIYLNGGKRKYQGTVTILK